MDQAAFDVVQARCHSLGNLKVLIELVDQLIVFSQQGVMCFDAFGDV